MILAETGCDELIDVLIVETAAPFDQCFSQSRQRGELAVLRQTTLTNGIDILGIETLLERQSRVERDRLAARVGHRIGEQQGLGFALP